MLNRCTITSVFAGFLAFAVPLSLGIGASFLLVSINSTGRTHVNEAHEGVGEAIGALAIILAGTVTSFLASAICSMFIGYRTGSPHLNRRKSLHGLEPEVGAPGGPHAFGFEAVLARGAFEQGDGDAADQAEVGAGVFVTSRVQWSSFSMAQWRRIGLARVFAARRLLQT
jgi:hypothetical protein